MSVVALRAAVLHCLGEPDACAGEDSAAIEYFADGLLIIDNGHVAQLGPANILLDQLGADVRIIDYSGRLIVPGFIDTHIHYPQTDMIAAYGEQLLEWLETYTFPLESRFADAEYASEVAEFFLDELLRNGTTTAQVLGTVHARSVDAIFSAAQARGLRLIAGKVMMDRNCPEHLRDTADSAYRDNKTLIERWHGQQRLLYAITPRFAPTSSAEQLSRAGQLAQEHPDVFIHTHLAENQNEVRWVTKLFPDHRSYLDVYDSYQLLRERSVLAHGIYLDDQDRQRLAGSGAALAFCPSANLFLGSGLFDWAAAKATGVNVGLGTDVGAGTSFNLLRTLSEAYKVAQLQEQKLTPWQALYLATLGSAKALYLDDCIGNFQAGKEADFVVLDPQATPLLARRTALARDLSERLFALIMLADDRVVEATYVLGQRVHQR